MLHILLLILKIIGIVIAVLSGIFLTVLCLVLFVPVHYQIDAKRREGEGNPPVEVKAKMAWLLHFVHLKFTYPSEVYFKLRILAFPVFRLPRKEKKPKAKQSKEKAGKKKETSAGEKAKTTENREDEEKTKKANKTEVEYRTEVECKTGVESKTENEAQQKTTERPATDRTADTKPQAKTGQIKFGRKIKKFFEKIYQLFQNIRYTILRIYDKIKNICENIEYYLNVLKSDTFLQAFSLCRHELGAVARYLKPRKLRAELTIGTSDPATTGQILAWYGILYPFLGNHVTVIGDFENQRVEGTVFVKGKIKVFTILKAGIRIYFNKDIRKLLKLFKKEEL